MSNTIRVLVGVCLIILVLILVGWLTVGSPDGDPGISVDTSEVEKDTRAMMDTTRETFSDAAQTVDDNVTIGSDD